MSYQKRQGHTNNMRTGIFHSSTQINGWKTFLPGVVIYKRSNSPRHSLQDLPGKWQHVFSKSRLFTSPSNSFPQPILQTILLFPLSIRFGEQFLLSLFWLLSKINTHKTVITGKGKNAKFSALSHEMPKSDINLKSKSHSIMFGGKVRSFESPVCPLQSF